jgi:hypothetical protein
MQIPFARALGAAAVAVTTTFALAVPAQAVTSKTLSDPSGDPVLRNMSSAPTWAKPDADILKVTYSKDDTRFKVVMRVRNLTRPACGWVAWEKVSFAGGNRVLWAGVDGCTNKLSLQYIKNGAYGTKPGGSFSYTDDVIRVSLPKSEIGAGTQYFTTSALTMQNNSCGCGYQDWSAKTSFQVR